MFSDTRRKKLRNRILFAVLGVFVLSFGVWLNYKTIVSDEAKEAAKNVKVEQSSKDDSKTKSTAGSDKTQAENKSKKTETQNAPETYLIKEVEGVVKVFLCDEEGNKELYLITSIPFELLSEEDQKLFSDGVEVETEEDLGKFLENFDS